MDKKYIALIGAVILLGSVIYASGLSGNSQPSVDSYQGATINGWITVAHTSTETGKVTYLARDEHNVLTDIGMNAVKEYLSGSDTRPAFDWIALSNTTAPTRTSASLANEISDCGFDRVQSTITDLGLGNWSISHTFTSTCDSLDINTTGIFNDTAANTGFLAGSSFTTASMMSVDTLAITWVFNVTGA